MIDCIDRNKLLKDIEEYHVSDGKFQHWVEIQPTVRCKDCKHSTEWYGDRRRCFLWCEDGISVFEDGFCNYWDQKDNEQNG